MSDEAKHSAAAEDSISTGDDTTGSSISLSIGVNSVRLREKVKTAIEEPQASGRKRDKGEATKWWLKRPETRLGLASVGRNSAVDMEPGKHSPSPDVSSSMKEFLAKEKFCKIQQKSDRETNRDKDDTLCDILASAAFDRYPSDFENATDEDIGSFLEEMSKIAGALSPSSAPERTKSGEDSSKNPTDEEKSVEELLEEAEKLVRENVALSKSASRSDTLIPDEIDAQADGSRARRLEEDIFHLIEQEVHKESEKIRKSPKSEKKQREKSPSFEILYENVNSLKPPTSLTLALQKKRFDEHKVEVSSSSDLDDPIDRHSRSEDPKMTEESEKGKDNLQKEITDVDKDFFDDLLRRSKEKMEGGMSGSSSFGQEDFSHFLRILQGQDQGTKDSKITSTSRIVDIKEDFRTIEKNLVFPEKEITEILEKELAMKERKKHERITDKKEIHEFEESDSSVEQSSRSHVAQSMTENPTQENPPMLHEAQGDNEHIGGNSHVSQNPSEDDSQKSEGKIPGDMDKIEDPKKVVNSKSELYTVGLTPRLELFADAIPKLLAERSYENVASEKADVTGKADANSEKRIPSEKNRKNTEARSPDEWKKSNEKSNPESAKLGSSRSYDQLSKPSNNLRSSLDDVRSTKSTDNPRRTFQQSTRSAGLTRASKPSGKAAVPKQGPRTKLSLKPTTSKFGLMSRSAASTMPSEISAKYPLAGGDSRRNLTKDDLEILCREEKRLNALLKDQIESESKLYKQQIESMRTSFEEELFALKKQNIILKAKIDELSLHERRSEISPSIKKPDPRINLLEAELEKQEVMLNTYEKENKRLIVETKRLQEEARAAESKKKANLEANEKQKLSDVIKDLREETLKLNLEITELRRKNVDAALKIDDSTEQNSLLKEELLMFKEQLKSKNDFINTRLQSMTTAELESRKQTEDLQIELRSKTEQLRSIRVEYEELQRAVSPLEKELLELRVKEGNLTEKLVISKSHVEREKQLTLKLKDQVILDNKKILDLNRQVREMERILKRKNPDSVSALILTAKSDHERINLEKVKLLEERIAALEDEIKSKEVVGQEKLTDLQNKFAEMKEKYVVQVMELETKLIEATTKEQKVFNDMFTQTIVKSVENKSVEAGNGKRDERERSSSLQIEREERKEQKVAKVGPKSQNPKEDAHLIATIRGLKLEIVNKDKSFAKMSKELQELQKTNRRLQREREKLLTDRRNFRVDNEKNGRPGSVCTEARIQSGKATEANDQNSNVYQNGHLSNGNSQRLSGSAPRLYDPLQYSENGESAIVRKLNNENDILKGELNKINKDFMTLKNKRLHDLNLLQEEHEREMAALVKEYSVKFGDSKVVKLQGQINTQVAIITHLKQQIEKLRDYKEQVIVLKVEREHLENKVKILNEKVKYLSTPGTEQLQLLQDKITILQQRHESREMTLQSLVRDLLRNRTQCRDCKGEKGKNNKQLCYFRQELDHILGMLQEISSVQ